MTTETHHTSYERRSSEVGRRASLVQWPQTIQEVIEEGDLAHKSANKPRRTSQPLQPAISELEQLQMASHQKQDGENTSSRRTSLTKNSDDRGSVSSRRNSSIGDAAAAADAMKPLVRRTSLTRRPSLVGIPYSNRFGRRNSLTRRSTSTQPAMNFKVHEAAVLEELIPIPQSPRFAATLSPEAQFALLKAYEDNLAAALARLFPEKRDHITRTRTPKNRRIIVKCGEDGADDATSMFSDTESVQSFSFITAPTGNPLTNVRPPGAAGVGAGGGLPRMQPPNAATLAHSMSENQPTGRTIPPSAGNSAIAGVHLPPLSIRSSMTDVPYTRQLALARRFQMAQSLLDSFDEAALGKAPAPAAAVVEPSPEDKSAAFVNMTPSNRRVSLDSFNPIQGYQWWSSAWNSEFEVI